MCSGDREIHKHKGSNPSHGRRGDWASTRGNGSKMSRLSDRRSPLDGLLWPINSRQKPTLYIKKEITMHSNTIYSLQFPNSSFSHKQLNFISFTIRSKLPVLSYPSLPSPRLTPQPLSGGTVPAVWHVAAQCHTLPTPPHPNHCPQKHIVTSQHQHKERKRQE